MKPGPRAIPLVLALLGVIACSGSVASTGNGDGGGGGGPACAPTQHRAAPKTCAVSSAPSLPDGGSPPSCATDTDCTTAGSGYSYCRGGLCSFDACLSDADCANGGVCGCSTDYSGGNAQYHPNICVPATCHVDSDCGAGGLCAASFGRCGTFDSYNCASSSAPACSSTESCSYSAEVGGFTCGAPVVCNG
jgi:hypothetical protein